jgi:hypothetical protein
MQHRCSQAAWCSTRCIAEHTRYMYGDRIEGCLSGSYWLGTEYLPKDVGTNIATIPIVGGSRRSATREPLPWLLEPGATGIVQDIHTPEIEFRCHHSHRSVLQHIDPAILLPPSARCLTRSRPTSATSDRSVADHARKRQCGQPGRAKRACPMQMQTG